MFWLGLCIGLYAGFAMGQWWRGSNKPLFRRPITRHATLGVALAPPNHYDAWRLNTQRALMLIESVAHEVGKTGAQLPSVEELSRLTGNSPRRWRKYLDVLAEGRVIFKLGRVGTYWIMANKGDRRRALTTLPYRGEVRPPDLRAVRISGTGRITPEQAEQGGLAQN